MLRHTALLAAAALALAGAARADTAADGKVLYEQKCAACHTIGGGDRIGPDLHGVAASRVLSARDCEDVAGEHWWIAGGSGADFRVVGGTAAATEDELRIAPALLRRLGARAAGRRSHGPA